ncbi:hypothetical protein QBC43DRAFT_201938 [Cladorrhinum sp. PSN259]|nr:hypothetical protein QBC43DRAFT_201938 [Cladorrhinum sp. PSN259]
MHAPLYLLTLLTLLPIPGALSLGAGNSATSKTVPDGADKLEECGCWPIYQAMLRCQKISNNSTATRECVCIPNPKGWYTSYNGCSSCVAYRSYKDDNFFDNYARTIRQLFVSCTEVGGGITSDGGSICASNAMGRACTGLREGGRGDQTLSWASYEIFKTENKGNGTQWLNIHEYREGEGESSDSESVTETKKVAVTVTRSTGFVTDTVDVDITSGLVTLSGLPTLGLSRTAGTTPTTTGSGVPTGTNTAGSGESSAMGRAVIGFRAGQVLSLVAAVNAVIAWL